MRVCLNLRPMRREAFALLLELLGWKYDKDGPKADSMTNNLGRELRPQRICQRV